MAISFLFGSSNCVMETNTLLKTLAHLHLKNSWTDVQVTLITADVSTLTPAAALTKTFSKAGVRYYLINFEEFNSQIDCVFNFEKFNSQIDLFIVGIFFSPRTSFLELNNRTGRSGKHHLFILQAIDQLFQPLKALDQMIHQGLSFSVFIFIDQEVHSYGEILIQAILKSEMAEKNCYFYLGQ